MPFRLADVDELPTNLRPLFDATDSRMRLLGFVPHHYRLNANSYRPEVSNIPVWVYYHPDERVYAEVSISQIPSSVEPVKIKYVSMLANGYLYEGHLAYWYSDIKIPYSVCWNIMELDWELGLLAFLDKLRPIASIDSRLVLEPGNYIAVMERFNRNAVEHLLETGQAKHTETGQIRFSWRRVFSGTFDLLIFIKKRTKVFAQFAPKHTNDWSTLPDETWVEIDMLLMDELDYVRTSQSSTDRNNDWRGKLLALSLSVVAFLIALSVTAGWTTAWMIFLIIFVHECGHLLAMKLCGYKDLRLLFIPFFGGAAIASEESPKAWQRFFVYLAGPLPCLVAAGCIYLVKYAYGIESGTLNQFLFLLIFINVFNLIPVQPLDGGRVISLALFGRVPYLKVVFHALSAVGLIVIGFQSDSKVIGFLGFLILLGMRATWLRARLQSQLIKTLPESLRKEGGRPLRKEILRNMRTGFFGKLSLGQKYQHLLVLDNELKMEVPGFGLIVLALFLYLSPLWLPFAFLPGLHIAANYRLAQVEKRAVSAGIPVSMSALQPVMPAPEFNMGVDMEALATEIRTNRNELNQQLRTSLYKVLNYSAMDDFRYPMEELRLQMDSDQVRKWVERFEMASFKPKCVIAAYYQDDIQPGSDPLESSLLHNNHTFGVDLLIAQALLEAKDGHYNRAIELELAALRICKTLLGDGTYQSQIVGNCLLSRVVNSLKFVLIPNSVGEQQAESQSALIPVIEELRMASPSDWRKTVDSALMEERAKRKNKGDLYKQTLAAQYGILSDELSYIGKLFSLDIVDQASEIATVLELRTSPAGIYSLDKSEESNSSTNILGLQANQVNSKIRVLMYIRTDSNHSLDLALAALSVYEYYAKHAQYPESLDVALQQLQLQPSTATAIRIDSLQYKPRRDGFELFIQDKFYQSTEYWEGVDVVLP